MSPFWVGVLIGAWLGPLFLVVCLAVYVRLR